MTKRIITIIAVLLAIFALILGGLWYVGRRAAEKNGSTPLTFRQFLGLSIGAKPSTTAPGTTSSAFTTLPDGTKVAKTGGANGTGTTTGTINGTAGGGAGDGTQTSQFTDSGISPSGGTATTIIGGGVSGTGTTTVGSGTSSTTVGNVSGGTTGAAAAAPICSDADLNITFTPTELARLNVLQDRFYAIAQNLHTDADVATEVANHDAFSLKASQAKELYAYCEAKLPLITGKLLQQHLSTPFWHEWHPTTPELIASFPQATPTEKALIQSGPRETDSNSFLDAVTFCTLAHGDPGCPSHISPSGLLDYGNIGSIQITGTALHDNGLLIYPVEKILRINLW